MGSACEVYREDLRIHSTKRHATEHPVPGTSRPPYASSLMQADFPSARSRRRWHAHAALHAGPVHATRVPGQTLNRTGQRLAKAVTAGALGVHVHLLMHLHMNRAMIRTVDLCINGPT